MDDKHFFKLSWDEEEDDTASLANIIHNINVSTMCARLYLNEQNKLLRTLIIAAFVIAAILVIVSATLLYLALS